jgi:hypothetical protein
MTIFQNLLFFLYFFTKNYNFFGFFCFKNFKMADLKKNEFQKCKDKIFKEYWQKNPDF